MMKSSIQHVLRESNPVQELGPWLLVGAYMLGVFTDMGFCHQSIDTLVENNALFILCNDLD